MVTQLERMWKSIDENTKTLKNLCGRVTTIETNISNHQKHKDKQTLILMAVMGVAVTISVTLINVFV